MGAHEADVNQAVGVVDPHDQAIFISSDVETNAVVGKEAGVAIIRFDLGGRFPIRALRELEPRFEGLLGVGMVFPKGF